MSKKATPPSPADDSRGGRSPWYTELKIEQNGHYIYLTTIPIDDLFAYCVVDRRHENPTEGFQQGFQRRLTESRADEIAVYINAEGRSLACPIIVSAQPEAEFSHIRENKGISFKRVPGAFVILNGQHRLYSRFGGRASAWTRGCEVLPFNLVHPSSSRSEFDPKSAKV